MFEHLANCHGEWNIILAFISSIPFIGIWLKHKLQGLTKKGSKDESRRFGKAFCLRKKKTVEYSDYYEGF